MLALVGIPLGLSARKGGKSTGFVLTILLVFIYYFFSLTGVSLARQGRLSPFLGVWDGTFFFVCGLLLLWRVDRMPNELGSVAAVWKSFKERLQGVGEFRPGPLQTSTGVAPLSASSGVQRRRFSARFPLILDDMILPISASTS